MTGVVATLEDDFMSFHVVGVVATLEDDFMLSV